MKNNPMDILKAFLDHDNRISLSNKSQKDAFDKLLQQVIKSSVRSISILYEAMHICFQKKHPLAMYVGEVISGHLFEKTSRRKVNMEEKKKSKSESGGGSGNKRWPPGIPKITKPADMCDIIINKPEKFSGEAVLRARLYLRQIRKAIPPTRVNEILSRFQYKEGLPLNVTPRTPMLLKKRTRQERDSNEDDDDEDDEDEDDEDDDREGVDDRDDSFKETLSA
jgi:hypothetical protein